jgi:hypothetical protein
MELGNNSPGSHSSGTILAPMRSDTSYMVKFCLNRAAECRMPPQRWAGVGPILEAVMVENRRPMVLSGP